jgi:hypothetical protein
VTYLGVRQLLVSIDVGYLKFFISTEQIDLSGVAQPSAFSEEGQKHWSGSMWRGASKRPSLWHTELIMVVQGRTKEILSQVIGRPNPLSDMPYGTLWQML